MLFRLVYMLLLSFFGRNNIKKRKPSNKTKKKFHFDDVTEAEFEEVETDNEEKDA